jgi:hypothetical protein
VTASSLVLAIGLAAAQGPAVGGDRLVVLLDDGALAAALAVDLALDALGGVPAGLLGGEHGVADAAVGEAALLVGAAALRLGAAALEVAGDEEGDEEVGQGRQVQHVEPDGESLANGGDAGGGLVLGLVKDALGSGAGGLGGDNGGWVGSLGGAKDGLLQAVEEGSSSLGRLGGGGHGARDSGHGLGDGDLDRDGIVDKGVDHGVGCADEELGNLQGGQGALDRGRDANVEGSDGVVGVLDTS